MKSAKIYFKALLNTRRNFKHLVHTGKVLSELRKMFA